MSSVSPRCLDYFCSPPGYLWEWEDVDGNQTAVWAKDHTTITYRAELEDLLESLADEGLPPLGAVLMVVAAASDFWDVETMGHHLQAAVKRMSGEELSLSQQAQWSRVASRLRAVHQLPAEMRASGPSRRALLQMVFENAAGRLPEENAREVLAEFYITPGLGAFQAKPPGLNGMTRLLRDMAALDQRLAVGATDYLEERLTRSAEISAPEELEMTLPEPEEPPPPGPEPDLLDALEAEGGELAQVAGLVRRLGAMLHVPRPVSSQEDLPVGGVSDITNRGDPSRLILTELAWDDMTFAARLAQGEALYMRRESPPAEPPPDRLVLVDTGIFMWGRPRLFALGCALALARQKGLAGCLRATASTFQPAPLTTVEEVRAHLEVLEPAPHPGEALANWAAELPRGGPVREVFLVTHPETLAALQGQEVWKKLCQACALHTIQVCGAGEVRLSRHSLAGARALAGGRIDLDETAHKPQLARVLKSAMLEGGRLPAFYQHHPWPLYVPVMPAGLVAETSERDGYLGFMPGGAVGFWRRQMLAARVLCSQLPAERILAVEPYEIDPELVPLPDSPRLVQLVLAENEHAGRLFVVLASLGGGESMPPLIVSCQGRPGAILAVRFQSGFLVVHRTTRSEAFNLKTGALKAEIRLTNGSHLHRWFDGETFHTEARHDAQRGMVALMQMRRPGSKRHRLHEIGEVGFASGGGLRIRKTRGRVYRLDVQPDGGLEWRTVTSREDVVFAALESFEVDHGTDQVLNLAQAVFPDGRRVVYDPLGFLHVISPNGKDGELSICLVKGHTSAWKSNGFYYGEPSLLWGEKIGASLALRNLCARLFAPVKLLAGNVAPT